MTRAGAVFCLALVAMVTACGGKDRPDAAASRQAESAPARSLQDDRLRLSCNQSWVPNRRTFSDRHWRRSSVRMGPLTFMSMRRAADVPVARYGSIKFRVLVEPGASVTITIGRGAQRDVGFYPMNVESSGELPRHATPILMLAGCPAVDRRLRVERGVLGVGYPVFLAVAQNRCVPLVVAVRGRRPIKRVVSIGAGSCAAS